jgi:hypothetical protein
MSKQSEREEFLVLMSQEGVPLDVARLVLRHGATLHRIAELECSSEAADRDRVHCPAAKSKKDEDCICEYQDTYRRAKCRTCGHEWDWTVRYSKTTQNLSGEEAIECPSWSWKEDKACGSRDVEAGPRQPAYHNKVPRIAVQELRLRRRVETLLKPFNVVPVFQGDPRGCVVKLKVPSGKTNDWGSVGICVP